MATPEREDQPASSPLDTEREKLRRDGYNDAEISQILVARALGSAGPSTSSGVLSNVLSSLMAVAGHARAAMPSFKRDFVTIFDATAAASARAGASLALVIKIVVIAVLGYAAWQEWNQHIISEPSIKQNEAIIKQQQTDIATMRNLTEEEQKNAICADQKLRKRYGKKYGCE